MLLVAAMVVATGTSATQTDRQIALAVLPLAPAEQEIATVLAYRDGELVELREGSGAFICLADRPGDERFQVACYHRTLEPFMARGRALRADGLEGEVNLRRRWEEIEAGTLAMPRGPTSLFQLFGGNPDGVTPDSAGSLSRLTVIYMPYATAEATGLPITPGSGMPWLMYPGEPTAHVMISSRP